MNSQNQRNSESQSSSNNNDEDNYLKHTKETNKLEDVYKMEHYSGKWFKVMKEKINKWSAKLAWILNPTDL